jgi:hypothetical protein
MKVVVRGLYYYGGKVGLRVGTRVLLQADPNNKFDSNAVAVTRLEGTLSGHVNRSDAAVLSPFLLEGMEVEATVHSINQGTRSGISCVLDLEIPEGFREAFERSSSTTLPRNNPPKQSFPSTFKTDRPKIQSVQPSVRSPDHRAAHPFPVADQKSSCFVATVVFESPIHPSVEWLRWWRDEHLARHFLGRMFILVYRYGGPLLASYVAHHPALKLILRQWVDRFVARERNRLKVRGK